MDIAIGLDASFVLVKPYVGVQASHADIYAGFAVNITRVAFLETALKQNVLREFNDINVVVFASHIGRSSAIGLQVVFEVYVLKSFRRQPSELIAFNEVRMTKRSTLDGSF